MSGWRMEVCLFDAPVEVRDALFEAVAEVAHTWPGVGDVICGAGPWDPGAEDSA